MEHLITKKVTCFPVSSPPALSPSQNNNTSGSFHEEKMKLTRDHRKQCFFIFEQIFGDVVPMEGDLVIINFFALEISASHLKRKVGAFCVCVCIIFYFLFFYSITLCSAPSSFERKSKQELPLLYNYFQKAPDNKICWKDVIHWMWPLFTDDRGTGRSTKLHLSPLPFTSRWVNL